MLKSLPMVLMAAGACLVVAACSVPTVGSRGAPCGRNQHAAGEISLPDSGFEAGGRIQVSFIQHDPDLAGELSEVAIFIEPPPGPGGGAPANPRIRLLNDAGQVFVDSIGRRDDPSGGGPGWVVLQWIKDAQTRNALYQSFANQALSVELWSANASSPMSRLRLNTTDYGVNPAMVCL